MWEVKINLRFLSTRHRIPPSCGCKARETVVAKCEIVLQGTSPVDYIRLIVPFKPYLAEKSSVQRSNCNIVGLTASVALFGNEARFSDLGCSSRHVISKTKSVTPHFFTFLTSLTRHLSMVKFSEKNQRKKIFARTYLRPVYTGDFCRGNSMQFLSRQSCNLKIARVNQVRFSVR